MLATALLSTVLMTTAPATDDASYAPTEVPAPVAKIVRLSLFDSNDDAQVVLMGVFPNSCYRVGRVDVEIDAAARTIALSPRALLYAHETCLAMQTPFEQVVRVGVLPAGTYQVSLDTSPLSGTLTIKRASSSAPDDYLYAPVTSAVVERRGGVDEVVLRGVYPRMLVGCMRMDQIHVTYDGEAIVVQPIARVDRGDACRGAAYAFALRAPLYRGVRGFSLLHVRVISGRALNSPLFADDGREATQITPSQGATGDGSCDFS